jgi:pimeloyl-ACP methyl ester carboxylesterase
MQTLHVNGYDMAYLDVGQGPPLVCVHDSLCDFRIWGSVIGPLTTKHRAIAVSLRHFFPDLGTVWATPIRSPSMSTT